MIKGIGCDIISISRIKRTLERNPGFVEKVFTPSEISYCKGKANAAQSFAARFAAKEAALKALGTGWAQQLGWQEIEVTVNEAGAPMLSLFGKAKELADKMGVSNCLLSLAHDADLAMAYVVLE